MSAAGLRQAKQKMRSAGASPGAVELFAHYYRQLEAGVDGRILEDTITPLLDPPRLDDMVVDADQAREAISATVMIKLNGGLGTSMGLDGPKSLLEVRDGLDFLDIQARQVLAARQRYQARLPLLLMNSFRTRDASLAALRRYPEIAVEDIPLDFLQGQEPKLLADDLTPVSWPSDPALEWCPPGHGDIYPALADSGLLDRLIGAGFRYASVANGDNLGAAPDATIAGWFASTGAPYAAEVCRRTVNDRKGGHLAVRKADGRLILRDTAQTAPNETHLFTDEHRHPYFHANNLWFDLEALRRALAERDGVLGLPLIRNEKTVDPADPYSPRVVQIETAMGAAIEVFDGARAICVGRHRFLPVKTTNELLLLRSDVFELGPDARLTARVERAPEVDLDPEHYRTIHQFEARIPAPPSLREAVSLRVRGDWTFGAGVVVRGEARLDEPDEPSRVPDQAVLGG